MQVKKWREEVDRAKGGPSSDARRLPQPAAPPPLPTRTLATLRENSAAFDAALAPPTHVQGAQRRRSNSGAGASGASSAFGDLRAQFAASLAQQGGSAAAAARVAASLEAALVAQGARSGGVSAEEMAQALRANVSLRVALLSGWLAPADAAALTTRGLMMDFLSDA